MSKITKIDRPYFGSAEVFRTSEKGWINRAIDFYLNGDDILVIDDAGTGHQCFVPQAAMRGTRATTPVWPVIRRYLREEGGIKAPARPQWDD